MTADDPTAVLESPTPPPMARTQNAFDMSERTMLAAFAMQGILASHTGGMDIPDPKKCAKWARQQADALLAELHDTTFPS